jgi:hypothetical protein
MYLLTSGLVAYGLDPSSIHRLRIKHMEQDINLPLTLGEANLLLEVLGD